MSARTNRAWLVAIAALAGCIEPSKIEDDALIAAASLRDGSVDLLPELGGAGGSGGAGGIGGAGGGAGRSGSGGAGGAGGAAGAAASNCGDVVATYLLPTCATEFCHGAMGTGTSPLKLMATNTSAGLIGTGASMDCDGEVYIDAEAPEQSLLYTKLGSDPPCGLRMPFGGTPAADAQRACVLEWIMDEVAQ